MKFFKFVPIIYLLFFSTCFEINAGRIIDFKKYLEQIEELSGQEITEKEKLVKDFTSEKYGDRVLEDEELEKSHIDFQNSKKKLIKEWEENTRISWPKYNDKTECIVDETCIKKNTGWNYDAHHIIPQSHNGPNEWWNLIPLDVRHHNLIHGTPVFVDISINSIFKKFNNSSLNDEGIFKAKRTLEPAFCCKIFDTSCIVKKFDKVRGEY